MLLVEKPNAKLLRLLRLLGLLWLLRRTATNEMYVCVCGVTNVRKHVKKTASTDMVTDL